MTFGHKQYMIMQEDLNYLQLQDLEMIQNGYL